MKDQSNFKVWYVVETAGTSDDGLPWIYSMGLISEDILRDHLPPISPETSVFMCGPPPIIKFACLPYLDKMGYEKARCHQF